MAAGNWKRTLGLPEAGRVCQALSAALARREWALVRPAYSEEVASQLMKSPGGTESSEEEPLLSCRVASEGRESVSARRPAMAEAEAGGGEGTASDDGGAGDGGSF
jgi:hypothetical protein